MHCFLMLFVHLAFQIKQFSLGTPQWESVLYKSLCSLFMQNRVQIVFSTRKTVLITLSFQRHQEYWSAVARTHEEDSIQHPGPERRDQLPQRVCSVI